MLTELMEKHKDQKVKLNPTHLKALIMENPKYSYLQDIVSPIPEPEKGDQKKKVVQTQEKPQKVMLKKRAPEKKCNLEEAFDDSSSIEN